MKPGDRVKQAWEWGVMSLLAAAYIVNLLHWNGMSKDAEFTMAMIQVGKLNTNSTNPAASIHRDLPHLPLFSLLAFEAHSIVPPDG